MWSEEPVVGDGMGVAYLRFSDKFHLSYSGWDEVQRYQTKWPSEVERDLRHDVDVHREGSAEY